MHDDSVPRTRPQGPSASAEPELPLGAEPGAWVRRLWAALLVALGVGAALLLTSCGADEPTRPAPLDPALVAQGRAIFRYDTYGDETFWTDTLRMHEVIQRAVDPTTALAVGLKVDADTLPPAVKDAIRAGRVDLKSPATTVLLLKLGAVVGVSGTVNTVNGKDTLVRVGITCALCHSSVDNSVAPGIGRRLDGWANTDVNPGAIVALSPALTPAQKAVYNSWGPGKYDPRFNFDRINGPVVIPPAYGLQGVRAITYTGDGDDVTYWNRYVAVTQMHGHGSFVDPRVNVDVQNPPGMVEPKLRALRAYQLSLERPAAGSPDPVAAARGQAVFNGAGTCATCHVGPRFTDANSRLHAPSEVGQDPTFAQRSATKQYRTTPLRGLLQHPPYFHDGSARTLADVVAHYNRVRSLNLTEQQQRDLVEYLKSL